MFLLYIIFIFFTIGGIAAFLAFSVSPILFWLQHGYWNLADPPKMILLGTCFLSLHSAIGFGGLLYLRRISPDENVDIPNAPIKKPWLSKTYWSQPIIQSKRILNLDLVKFLSRYFAIISLFPLFAISESIKLIDYTALVGLIFPALALLFYLRLKKMQGNQYLYDPIPLTLNPYPSFIEEKCQGHLDTHKLTLNIQYVRIELQCVLHKQAGDDYEKEVLWNEKMQIDESSLEKNTSIAFSFDLKQGLKEAQTAEEYPFIAWRIYLHLTLEDGFVMKREYNNIPIFKQPTV